MPSASTRQSNLDLQTGARLALFGAGVNVVMAVTKLTAGIFGHSQALIADGVESSLDVVSSAILWSGLKYAARPADLDHPYGHGKAEPIAGVIVSLLILVAALMLAISSARGLWVPRPEPASFTLVLLVAIICIKETLYRSVRRIADRLGSVAIRADALHHRSDAITSVAALAGVSLAVFGGPKYAHADSLVALGSCGWIAYSGFRILIPALHDLLDAAPPSELASAVRQTALSVPGVSTVEQLRIRKMGLELYVDLHLEVNGLISVREGHQIAHQVKDSIRAAHGAVADVLVHVEPAAEVSA